VALDTAIDEALAAEGMAREVAHRLQALRKAAGYEISDRIRASVSGPPEAVAALESHRDWLAGEVLAVELEVAPDATLEEADATERMELEGRALDLAVARAAGAVG